MHPAQFRGLRRYGESGVEKTKIMAVPRPGHEPVLSERHRLPISILGPVRDAEDAQKILGWGVAAVEYIALEISRGRVRIPAHVY
jgi:hypothetical protein